MYDGKHQMSLYFLRALTVLACHLYDLIPSSLALIIVIIIHGLFIAIFAWDRIDSVYLTHHYLNYTPVMISPIAYVFARFISNAPFNLAIVVVVLHACLYHLFKAYRQMMTKHAHKIFGPLSREEVNEMSIEVPTLIPGGLVTLLRLMAASTPDPQIFERVLAMQKKRATSHTSTTIEVIRLCAVYPTRRHQMLEEICSCQTNSYYNSFMLCILKRSIESLVSEGPTHYIKDVESRHRSFLIHHHLYWNARKDDNKKEALFQSMQAAFFYFETKCYLEGLMRQFPHDRTLRDHFATFNLTGIGNYDDFKIYKQHHNSSLDPVLSPMISFNPRVHSFLTETEMSNSTGVSNISGDPSTDLSTKMNRPTNIVAAYIKQSHRRVPFFPVIVFIIPIFCVIGYLIYENSHWTYVMSKSLSIAEDVMYALDSVLSIGRRVFVEVPISLIASTTNTDDIYVCRERFATILDTANDFQSSIPILRHLNYSPRQSLGNNAATYYGKNINMCGILGDIATQYYEKTINSFDEFTETVSIITGGVNDLFGRVNRTDDIFIVLLFSIGIVLLLIIYLFAVPYWQINNIMKDDDNAIEYLASRDRLTSFLLEHAEEGWDILVKFLPEIPPALLETSIQIMSDFTSHTISTSESTSQRSLLYASAYSLSRHAERKLRSPLASKQRHTMSFVGKRTPTELSKVSFAPQRVMHQQTVDFGSIKITPKPSSFIEVQSADEDNGYSDTVIDNDNDPKSRDDDPVTHTIDKCIREDEKTWSLILVFLPAIFFGLACISMMIPIYIASRDDSTQLLDLGDGSDGLNGVSALFAAIYKSYREGELKYDLIEEADIMLKEGNNDITRYYQTRVCYQLTLELQTCTSIEQIAEYLGTAQYENVNFTHSLLPILMDFMRVVATDIIYDKAYRFHYRQHSSEISFYFAIGLLLLLYLLLGVAVNEIVTQSFNSLFHFPDELLKKAPDIKLQQSDVTFPDNVIVVTSIARSNEIYSISENAMDLLQREPFSLICRNLDKVFPMVAGSPNMREHTLRDRKTRKLFRAQTLQSGFLQKTILVESKALVNTGHESMTQKLSTFLPLSLGKHFTETHHAPIHYDGYLVLAASNMELSQPLIEKGYSSVASITNNYGTVQIVLAEADMIVFAATTLDVLVPYMFVRDLISSDRAGFLSKFVIERATGNVNVVPQYEPFINIQMPEVHSMLAIIRKMPGASVGFGHRITPIMEADVCVDSTTTRSISIASFLNHLAFRI